MTSYDFSEVYWYSGLQALFVTVFHTSVDLLCKKIMQKQLFAQIFQWRLFIFISRASKWGTLKSAGNPRCAVHADIHSICTARPRPGSAAGVRVSPTSDTWQSVAILMNRPHCFLSNHTVGCCNINCGCLSQIRREKICFASEVSIFLLYFLRDCSYFDGTFGQLFTLRPLDFLF